MWTNWKAVGIAACCGLALSATALAQPVNDNCADAGLSPIPAAGGTVTGTTVGATNDGAGCGSTGAPGFDVYHAFAPAADGPWMLSLCATSVAWDSVLSIHTGCPTSAGNLVAGSCADDDCGGLSELPSIALVASTPYIVRVSTYNSTGLGVPSPYTLDVTNLGVPGACCATNGSCNFSAGGPTGCVSGETFQPGGTCSPTNTCPQPPANDNCANAAMSPIPGAGGNVTGTTVAASPEAAFNDPACGFTNGQDVWHAWTPDNAGPWKLALCGTTPSWDSVISIHQGCPIDNTTNNLVACNDDFCAPLSSIESVTLAAATPYVVRVSTYSSSYGPGAYTLNVIDLNAPGNCCLAGACTLTTTGVAGCDPGAIFTPDGVCTPTNPCPQPPANDVCTGAIDITALPYTVPAPIVLDNATDDVGVLGDGSCNLNSTTVLRGVWFKHTTGATGGTFQMREQSSLDSVMAIFSSTSDCSGLTFLSCSDGAPVTGDEFFYPAASPSTTYYFLVGKWGETAPAAGSAVNFSLNLLPAVAPPTNDACAGAAVISSLPFDSGPIIVGGATDDQDVSCNADAATMTRGGIWFQYTPATACLLQMAETGSIDTITAVFTGPDCSSLTEVACNDAESSLVAASAGVAQYILVGRWSNTTPLPTDSMTFTLDCVQPQANDECTGAVALTVGTPTSDALGVASGTSITTCDGSPLDIWYSFAATAGSTYRISVTPASPADESVALALFDSCPAVPDANLNCNPQPFTGEVNEILWPAATSATLYIRAGFYTGDVGSFSILVETVTPPAPPANDLCTAAIVIPSAPYDSGPIPFFSATHDTNIDPSCDQGAGPPNRGVWWSFTPASTIAVAVSTGDTWNTSTSIWTGADCNALAEVHCSNPETFTYTFTGGTTHYICVSLTPNTPPLVAPLDAVYQLTFTLPPANDICSNAVNIGPSGNYSENASTAAAAAEALPPSGACDFDTELGSSIWYTFTPSGNGSFRIQATSGYDGLVVLYSGATCDSAVEVADDDCDGDGGFGPDNADYTRPLTGGTTYYVGVGTWGGGVGGPVTLQFTFTPDVPANDNCCRGTTCNPVASGTCTGVIAGSNSLVVTSCGAGNAFASCCYADFNHDGTQSIDDLFLYFNAYFTGSPMADFGGDGTSQPTIDDLFLYINAYFGTCS